LSQKQSLIRHESTCRLVLQYKENESLVNSLKEELKCVKEENKVHIEEGVTLKKSIKDLKEKLKMCNIQKKEFRDQVRVHKNEITILNRQNIKHIEKLYVMAEKQQVINNNDSQNYVTNSTTRIDSKSIHNTIHLQPFDLSDEKTKHIITDALVKMSEDQFQGYLKGGQKGIARAVHDLVLSKNGNLNLLS
jgi:hypothetical protein